MIFNGRKSSDWVVAAHCHRPHTLESPASSSTLAGPESVLNMLVFTCLCIFIDCSVFVIELNHVVMLDSTIVLFCTCLICNIYRVAGLFFAVGTLDPTMLFCIYTPQLYRLAPIKEHPKE